MGKKCLSLLFLLCCFSFAAQASGCVGVSITSQPASITDYAGNVAVFSVGAIGTAPFNYAWYRNGTAIPGATDSAYSISFLQMSDSGSSFYCVVSNCNDTVLSSAFKVFIFSKV